MEVQGRNYTKLCSFYISDWHLVTMLLPYINKKIEQQAKIATILEKDIQKNIETLLEKLNLKNKEKILKLNWGKTIIKAKNELDKIFNNDIEELNIIINGNDKFIEKINLLIDMYIKEKRINKKINIINCYEVIDFNGNIGKILDNHDKVLNTSGEKEISEVFQDYNKNKLKAI